MEYKLLVADNIHLQNAEVKGVYSDKETAMRALQTEITLAKAQHGIQQGYVRFIGFPEAVAVDFGSWSDFLGLTGVSLDDFAN